MDHRGTGDDEFERNDYKKLTMNVTRRHFFSSSATGISTAALASLLNEDLFAKPALPDLMSGLPDVPHFAPKAKRVIYMYQSGAPSQVDLFDPKPSLEKLTAKTYPTLFAKANASPA